MMDITVPVENVTGKFILRNHLGEGSYGDEKLELSAAIPDGSPVIHLGDQYYIVSIHDIAKAVCECVEDIEPMSVVANEGSE